MSESRLELDDDGRVVGGDGAVQPLDLVLAAEQSGRVRLPRRTGAIALGALALLALWFTLRPAPPPAVAATVSGVGLFPAVRDGDPLVALYRVAPPDGSGTVEVFGLVGPGVRASSTHADPDGRGTRIAVVPDCLDPAPPGSFSLAVRVSSPAGTATEGLLPLTDPGIDWAAAIEDRCWTESTRAGISLVGLRASADISRGLVRISATLRNDTARDLAISAVDVADVATLEAAPASTLSATASTTAAARVTARCGTASSPPSLSWAVGPAGETPRLTLMTPLAAPERRSIAQSMAVLCSSPPPTSVHLVSATAVPSSGIDAALGGAAIDLRFRVSTGGVLVGLGDDPAGSTADARRAFGYAVVTGPVKGTEVTVRWDVVCSASRTRSLPVETRTQRLAFQSAVPLTGPAVTRALTAACGRAG
jgi:hypothetical protein